MIICDGITDKNTMYAIDDSFMAVRGSTEEQQIIDAQRKMAHEILVRYAKRKESIE